MKIPSERPDLWRAIVSLIAMLYLSVFSNDLVRNLRNFQTSISIYLFNLLILIAWIFLIRDLFHQILLFRSARKK